MKATIERGALLSALSRVQGVVERRNTIPILSNVRLEVLEGGLRLLATDLDIEVLGHAKAQPHKAGALTAPAAMLHDIVRKLPVGADVQLAWGEDDPRLVVSAGRSRFQLPVLPAGDFPEFNADGIDSLARIGADDLGRLIDRVRFAISTEETRYYLNGIYLHPFKAADGVKLRAVSTDGHRLALAEMPCPAGLEEAPGVIVPRKAVGEIRKLLEGAGEEVSFGWSRAKIRLDTARADAPGEVLTSKAIDGAFPDYMQVIPRDNARVVHVDVKALSSAVDRVATISGEKARSTKLTVEPGRLTLAVRNMDAGSATEVVEIDYDGDTFDVGFNARYLLDVCAQMTGETMEVRFADPASPTLVLDPGDAGVQFVLMPLRV